MSENIEVASHADVHMHVSVFKKEGLRTASLKPRGGLWNEGSR